MKKAAISIITCICMLVGMLSFSLPVNAASITYLAGDVIATFESPQQTSVGSLTVPLSSDGHFSPSSSYLQDSSIRSKGLNQARCSTLSFYLPDGIPINSRVQVEFGFRFWITPDDSAGSSISFYDLDFIPANPGTSYSYSEQTYRKEHDSDREFYYRVVFDNPVYTESIIFNQVVSWFQLVGSASTYSSYVYLLDCRVSYVPIVDNPNGDVLKDIRNNTSNTTDAVNNQTTTITNNIKNQTDTMTNGYDNSSMSDDNTRLNDQIAQYDQAQESATNTSVSNIDAAEFINPSSNTSVFAAMTFSASFLQSLYNNLGDFGIVVMVSLSLCLGLMLVGWFKYRKGG